MNLLKQYNNWQLFQKPCRLIRACTMCSLFTILCLLFLSTGIAHASEYINLNSRISQVARESLAAKPSVNPTSTPTPVVAAQTAPDAVNWLAIIAPTASVVVVLLSGIIAALGYLYRHERERREEVERQLSEHKYNAYIALMNTYLEVTKASNADKPLKPDDLVDRMQELSKDFIIYGSDDVVRAFQKWVETGRKGRVSIRQFGELVVAIRRDMGNKKTKITYEEVLRQFISDYDDAKAKGLI